MQRFEASRNSSCLHIGAPCGPSTWFAAPCVPRPCAERPAGVSRFVRLNTAQDKEVATRHGEPGSS